MPSKNEELFMIMTKFADSGWDLICESSEAWINGKKSNDEILPVIVQANDECGRCGCEFDPLYKKAIDLLSA